MKGFDFTNLLLNYQVQCRIGRLQPNLSTVDLKIATDYRPKSPFYFSISVSGITERDVILVLLRA